MTSDDAAEAAGMSARVIHCERNEWLTCQLGRREVITVDLSKRRDGSRLSQEEVFHLIAYGSTWQRALAMLEEIRKFNMTHGLNPP